MACASVHRQQGQHGGPKGKGRCAGGRRCYLRSYTARLGLTVRRVGPPDTGSTHTGMPARVPMSHGPGWSEDNKVPRYSACTHARSPWEITESGVPRFSTRVASRITLRGAGVHALFIAQPDCGISPPEHTRRGRRVFSRDLRRRPGWRSRRISALLRVVEGCRGSAAPRASNSLHWMEPNAAPHRVSLVQHESKRVTTTPSLRADAPPGGYPAVGERSAILAVAEQGGLPMC